MTSIPKNYMNRKIVIDLGALHNYGDEYAILKLLKDCGVSSYDATLFWKGTTEHIGVGKDYPEKAKKLRLYADSLGMTCEQAHAYFTGGISEEAMRNRYDFIPKEMHIASILGAKAIVIHAINEFSFEENIEYIKTFIPYAHKYDIKIAVENCWGAKDSKPCPMTTSTPESFVKFLDTINDDHVIACLDIGHAEMNQLGTSAASMIKALGPRLFCLHIHDNDKWCDAHQMPYTHKIPYATILKELKNINYQGNITFEVETCYSKGECPEAQLPLELYPAFIKLELEIGKYFANYLDK
mgnify:CR=1 FL=1